MLATSRMTKGGIVKRTVAVGSPGAGGKGELECEDFNGSTIALFNTLTVNSRPLLVIYLNSQNVQ